MTVASNHSARRTAFLRKIALGTLGLGALTALAACAQLPPSAQLENCAPTSAFPVEITGEGNGPVIQDNAIAALTMGVTLEDGTEVMPELFNFEQPDGSVQTISVNALGDSGFHGIPEALRCAQEGQHVEATMRLDQLFAAELLPTMTDADASATVTLSADVVTVYHSAATGRIAPQQNGIPAVVTAPDGTPGVTMPQELAPQDKRVATTIRGFGPDVAEGQRVTIQVLAVSWSTESVLTNTWDGETGPFQTVVSPDDGMFGISQDLVGAPVGSQVVVVLPGSVIAETASPFAPPFGNGDTVVFVIDILGAE